MPDLAALASFIIGPGGALALALVLFAGFIRGWIVPGFIYTATVAQLERAVAGLESNSAALDRLTDEIRGRASGKP